jgi:hypothetical protein
MRMKIFLWLAFRRRHWTADRRIRHNLEASETCLLCDQEPETIDHILCSCSYIKQVWWEIFRSLRISCQQHLIKVLRENAGSNLGCVWSGSQLKWNGSVPISENGATPFYVL